MTLVVCMKSSEGIVLAADSRGTIGDPRGLTAINDTQVKIFPLGKCGLGLAGASEMGAVLLDELRKKDIDSCSDVDEAVTRLVAECAQFFRQWFQAIPPQQRPAVLLTLAGYRFDDSGNAEPLIYLLNSQMNFAPQLFSIPCLSGVPQYAVYLVHRYYDPSISLEKAKALAEYLISETASQDPKVGGPIRIAEVTPDNGYRELTEEEVRKINDANKELNLQLREFFLERQIE